MNSRNNTIAQSGFMLFAVIVLSLMFTAVVGEAKQSVEPVKNETVCMINNAVMGKPQIPVVVNGKTYYGCCKNCAAKLKADRSARFAKDPVTGREVDKSAAFITATSEGDAIYFESRESAEKYYAAREKK
ncbi:MAG: TRASH domain-containing protein [Deltaproteobacteria bacterium]|nr:TRASH domain-containing protein [Deltaproteobacteria bacterium]